MVLLKTRTFVKQNKAEFTNVSGFTLLPMCNTHCTLSCRTLLFSLPTTNSFFQFVYSEITGQSAWKVLFRPLLWQLKVIRTWLTSILYFWYPGPSYLVQEVLVITVFVLSVLYTKKGCRARSSADTVQPFFTILQFSSELSNNWGTGLPCLCPLWIYCTGQQHKASLFPCSFSCLSSLCLQLLCHGSYLPFAQVLSFHTCTIMSPFLQNADFPFSSTCLPLLGHMECPSQPS